MITVFASLVLLGGLQDPVRPPLLTRIVVQPDTVWFAGPLYGGSRVDTVAYALVRRTGQWLRTGSRRFSPPPKLLPQSLGDTVPLLPGFGLVLRTMPDAAADTVTGLPLGMVSTVDGRLYPLIPALTKNEAQRLRPSEGLWYGTDMNALTGNLPLARPSGAWAVDRDAVWFGLAGGFSEGYGGVGGLLRFDVPRRAVESIWHDQLLQVAVTSMSIAGSGLWIGTVHYGEYGPGGWVGLLRYDLRTRSWLRYQADSTPLPGNAVWETATDGHRLWVSTDRGLAEMHLRTGRWRVAYFEPVLRGDSIVHELAATRPSPVIEKTITLTHRLAPKRPAEFLEAIRKLPPQRFACEMDMQDCQVDALATAALMPFLLEALSGSGADLAALALQRLGDPSVLPALRKALGVVDTRRARVIAVALNQMGDPAGRVWIREQLHLRPDAFSISAAGEIRDTGSIPRLIQLLPMEYLGNNAMSALTQFQSRSVWRQVAESVLANPAGTEYFLLYALNNAPRDDSAFAEALNRIHIRALRSPSRHAQTLAAQNLIAQHDTLGIPHIIRLMTEDQYYMPVGEKLAFLVEATGVDSLPVSPSVNWDSNPQEIRRAQAVWMSWWEQSRRYFRFPSKEQGRAAVRRWRERWADVGD